MIGIVLTLGFGRHRRFPLPRLAQQQVGREQRQRDDDGPCEYLHVKRGRTGLADPNGHDFIPFDSIEPFVDQSYREWSRPIRCLCRGRYALPVPHRHQFVTNPKFPYDKRIDPDHNMLLVSD